MIIKKEFMKNAAACLIVALFGFLLLNAAFLLYWAVQLLFNRFVPLFHGAAPRWFFDVKYLVFLVIIALISLLVFQSKLKTIFKAIYSTVPTAVLFVTAGIFLNRWKLILYAVCFLIFSGIILYLFRAKKQWIFYYAVTLAAGTLFVMEILGVDL